MNVHFVGVEALPQKLDISSLREIAFNAIRHIKEADLRLQTLLCAISLDGSL